MKFAIFSDTHFKNIPAFDNFMDEVLKKNKDTRTNTRAILAGDIFEAPFNDQKKLVPLVYHLFKTVSYHFKEVFFVMGNHEFFKSRKTDEYIPFLYAETAFKKLFNLYCNVKLLNKNNFIYIEEEGEIFEILGCTLWSKLDEDSFRDSSSSKNVTDNYLEINKMNEDHIDFLKNRKTKQFFENRKNVPKSIVVTHFPPIIDCVP